MELQALLQKSDQENEENMSVRYPVPDFLISKNHAISGAANSESIISTINFPTKTTQRALKDIKLDVSKIDRDLGESYQNVSKSDLQQKIEQILVSEKILEISSFEANIVKNEIDRLKLRERNLKHQCQNFIEEMQTLAESSRDSTNKLYETLGGPPFYKIREVPIIQRMRNLTQQNMKLIRPVYDKIHSENSPQKKNLVVCASPKTGTTSWQLAMIAIQKNRTIADLKADKNIDERDLYQIIKRFYFQVQEAQNIEYFDSNFQENFPLRKVDGFPDLATAVKKFRKNALKEETPLLSEEDYAQILFGETGSQNDQISPKTIRLIHTRHPLARVYSCWGDKVNYWREGNLKGDELKNVQRHNQETKGITQGIFRMAKKFETPESLKTKDNLSVFSLEAFLKFILAGSPGTTPNKHYVPIWRICNPCTVNYNFVTKLETIEQDSRFMIEKVMDVSEIGQFPSSNKKEQSLNKSKSDDYIKNLQKKFRHVTKDTMRQIIDYYKWDFRFFNYDFEKFLDNPYTEE